MLCLDESYPAIIDKEEWNMVQEGLANRDRFKLSYPSHNPFCSKLICGCCGHFYGAKVWHSNTAHRKVIVQCNKKFDKDKEKCDTPSFSIEDVQQRFLKAYNKVMADKKTLIEDTSDLIKLLTNTAEIDGKIEDLNNQISDIRILVEDMIKDNSSRSQNQTEYMKRYNSLIKKYEDLKHQLDDAISERVRKLQKAESMQSFLKEIKDRKEVLQDFDMAIWNTMIDVAIVNKNRTIEFKFKNGTKVVL